MKIAVICDVLNKENNGTSVAAMNLIRSLRAKGHEVRVVCPDEDKRGLPDYYIVPKMDLGILNPYVEKNGVALAIPDDEVLLQALDQVDAVHLLIPFMLSRRALLLCRERGIPITASFHCQAENFTSHIFMKDVKLANDVAYRIFYDKVYKYCDCVHYPTEFICDEFERHVGHTNHYIISNGVNSMFRPHPTEKPEEWRDKFVVLFTGRYSKEKSHKVLINAVARSKYKDRIQLVFAGDGPLKEKLIRYSKRKLPVQPVFKFFSRSELLDVINCSDMYVHPAEIEIEAIACLEAIACGKTPLIADSKRSATRAFALSPMNLFKNGDPRDLAKKLDWWLEHPKEREISGMECLHEAKQFDFDRCMDRMEGMIKDAVRKGGRAANAVDDDEEAV